MNGLVNLVNQVNSGTQLIDGIGTQMHLSVSVISWITSRRVTDHTVGIQQGGAGGALSALQKLASAKVDEVAITGMSTAHESWGELLISSS